MIEYYVIGVALHRDLTTILVVGGRVQPFLPQLGISHEVTMHFAEDYLSLNCQKDVMS